MTTPVVVAMLFGFVFGFAMQMKRARRGTVDDDDDDDDSATTVAAGADAGTSSEASTDRGLDLQRCLSDDNEAVVMADLVARAAALEIDPENKSRERLCYEVAVNEWERGGDADNATWRRRWAAVRSHMDVLERLGVVQQGALCKYGDFIEDPEERAAAIRDGKLPILDLMQEPIAPDDVVTLNNRCMSRKFLFQWFRSGQDRTTNPRNPYTKEEMSREDVAATGFDPKLLRAFNNNATEYRRKQILALMNALKAGRTDEIARILRSGMDLNFTQVLPNGQQVPLGVLLLGRVVPLRPDLLQLFIDAGAPMDAVLLPQKLTLMHFAAKMQPKEIVDMLIEHGAPVDSGTDRDHETPLAVAIEAKRKDVIDSLVDAGANANTSLILATTTIAAPELLEYMISKGLDVNMHDDNGVTTLHGMVDDGDVASVARLLEVGADVNAQTSDTNETPLHLAARKGNVELVRQLLAAGADPTLRTRQGQTAEDLAKEHEHPLVVQALQNYRAP